MSRCRLKHAFDPLEIDSPQPTSPLRRVRGAARLTSAPRRGLGPQAQRNITALDNAQTSMNQAIGDAEQQQGGKAVKSSHSGSATYDVGLVKDGRLHTAMIDASTGQMTRMR